MWPRRRDPLLLVGLEFDQAVSLGLEQVVGFGAHFDGWPEYRKVLEVLISYGADEGKIESTRRGGLRDVNVDVGCVLEISRELEETFETENS